MGESLAIKIINILFYFLFAIGIVLGVMFFVKGSENGEPLIVWSYVSAALAIGAALIFTFANIFKSKKSLISSIIVFTIFGVLVLISYTLANDAIPLDAVGEAIDDSLSASGSRWSGTSLFMLYILLGISFISLIFTEIRGALK